MNLAPCISVGSRIALRRKYNLEVCILLTPKVSGQSHEYDSNNPFTVSELNDAYCRGDVYLSRVLEIVVSREQVTTRAGRVVTPCSTSSPISFATPVLYARRAVSFDDALLRRLTSLTHP